MDRLSNLPDNLLLHILSFLPMDDVVRTTRISKQFYSLWPLSSSLIFTHRESSNPKDLISNRKFVSFIDKSLLLLNTTVTTTINPVHQLTKFYLDFPYQRCFSPDITVWLTFIHTHKVKDLSLTLTNEGSDGVGEQYILPKRFSRNPFLQKLTLSMCSFKDLDSIKWDRLTELKIESTTLSNFMLKNFASGCPLLELLELRNCDGYSKLEFDEGKLIKLVINGYAETEKTEGDPVEIWTPKVKFLEISGCLNKRKILLTNVSSVVKVKLDFNLRIEEGESCVLEQQMFESMLVSLSHAKDVTIGSWCIEVLLVNMQCLKSRLLGCSRLTLKTPIYNRYLPVILRLFQNYPKVETLIIQQTLPYFEFQVITEPSLSVIFELGGSYWTSGAFRFGGPFFKFIEISGFEGASFEYEIPFLQFLLKISTDLKKMVVRWNGGRRKSENGISEQNQVNQRLLSFGRSSKKAEIEFEM